MAETAERRPAGEAGGAQDGGEHVKTRITESGVTKPDALAALGYQPVFCVQRSNGDWTPLMGSTGGASWGGAANAEPLGGRPYRPALRPPPDVLIIDVDGHPVPGLGAETIAKMEADLGPLPPTWHLTARGPGSTSARYLYRIPDDLIVNNKPFIDYGGQVDAVRTGWRFSWAPGDIHPGTGQPVTCYGPDGTPCDLPHVGQLSPLPEAWVRYFREFPERYAASLPDAEPVKLPHLLPPGVRAELDRDEAGRPRNAEGAGPALHKAVMALARACWDAGLDQAQATAVAALSPYPEALARQRRTTMAREIARSWGCLEAGAPPEPGWLAEGRIPSQMDLFMASARDMAVAAARGLVPAALNGHGQAAELAQVMEGPVSGQAPAYPTLRLVPASSIKPTPVRWLWKDKLKLGGLALLAGNVGLGKSTIGADIAARLTRGTLAGAYAGTPQDVILCATEDEWGDTVVPRLMAANADLGKVSQLTTAQEYGPDLMLPVQVPELARLITESGARLVILDPLMSRLDGRLDSHKDAEVRRALEPLVRMAGETGVTVLGLIHQNKSGDHDAINRVMGSRAFTAVARSVLYAAPLLTRDPSGETLVLAVAKSNLSARGMADAYRIEPVILPGAPVITTTRIHWLDKLESFYLDIELAEAGRRKGMSARDKAAEWLADYLAGKGGRADSADVRKDGKAAGHSVATLKRAMAEVGATAENTKTTPRRTEWVLDDYDARPAQDPGAQSAHGRGGSASCEPTGYRGMCVSQQQPTELGIISSNPAALVGSNLTRIVEPTGQTHLASDDDASNLFQAPVGSKPADPPRARGTEPAESGPAVCRAGPHHEGTCALCDTRMAVRRAQVAELKAAGLSNAAIAHQLGVSDATVAKDLRRVGHG